MPGIFSYQLLSNGNVLEVWFVNFRIERQVYLR